MKREQGTNQFPKTLVIAAVILLVFCLGLIASTTIWSRKDMQDRIDARLEERATRIKKILTYHYYISTIFPANLESEDEEAMADFFTNEERLIQLGNYAMEIQNTPLETDAPLTIYTYYFEDGKGGSAPLFRDEFGDVFFIWNGYVVFEIDGYAYSYSLSNDFDGSAMKVFTAMNVQSSKDSQMKDLAREYIDKGEKSGWHENYRYYCWEIRHLDGHVIVVPDGDDYVYSSNYTSPDPLYEPMYVYEKDAEKLAKDSDSLGCIFFYDASSERSLWVKHMAWNAIVVLSAYIVCMIILALLFYIRRNKSESEVVAPETKVVKSTAIPENIAKELLSYIEQSENSTGPSGYLDQMKESIRNNTEIKDSSDPSSDSSRP
ncbi:MAG: hypothetical protein J6Y08_01520 [Clostridiales bacterium]|nr:hypothetical protein [Clostridiales bacterium]